MIIYSQDAAANVKFFRDVLQFPYVDAGNAWLIFRVPPTELAVHPAGSDVGHELFLMCEDMTAFRAQMSQVGVATTPPTAERWGVLTRLSLPGGGTLGVYEPTHPSPQL